MNGLGIPEQGIDGLSERGQVSLDHTPDDLVVHRCVIVELLAFAEARDAIGRALDIKQVFPRFKPNRARSFPARRAGGSRGFRALPG